MTFWQRLTGTQPRLPVETLIKLRAGRFHQILDTHKRFNALIQDAVEKLGGEFVIDKQYLAGLADGAFALAGDMVRDMNVVRDDPALSRYFIKLDRMKADLRRILAWQPQVESVDMVIPLAGLDELDHYHQAGGLFVRLAEIRQRLGLLVPESFVITFAAFNLFVKYNGLEELLDMAEPRESLAMDKLRQRIRNGGIPPEMMAGVESAMEQLSAIYGEPLRFIVRGAAMGEEYRRSVDGEYRTVSAVNARGVLDAYRAVAASLYSEQAVADRAARGLPSNCHIAVAVSRLVPAQVQGTIETVNPDAPHKGLMRLRINAQSESQCMDVSRRAPFDIVSSSAPAGAAHLAPDHIASLAEKAMRIERYFRGPQHIVWAREQNRDISIIQTRPLILDPDMGIAPEDLAAAVSRHEVLYDHQGSVASPGMAAGPVFLAATEQDLETMPERAVLVAGSLEPSRGLLLALRRAAAILTDKGETAGHAAALAREFHVPAIVNLGHATTRLQPGQEITVDADDNVVYSGAVEELLAYQMWEYLDLDMAREYSLLRFVLHRLSLKSIGGSQGRRTRLKTRETVDDVARLCLDTACLSTCAAVQSAAKPGKNTPKLANTLGLKLGLMDIGGGLRDTEDQNTVDPGRISSPPLAAFWNGLVSSGLDRFAADAAGLAVVSREHMFLHMCVGARTYVLDAYQCDDPERHYIYGRVSDTSASAPHSRRQVLWLKEILESEEFITYTVHGGFTAWKYNLPGPRLEQTLRMLGGMLGFAERRDGTAASGSAVDADIQRFMEAHHRDPAPAL
jgi:pyruvate,water dikinase